MSSRGYIFSPVTNRQFPWLGRVANPANRGTAPTPANPYRNTAVVKESAYGPGIRNRAWRDDGNPAIPFKRREGSAPAATVPMPLAAKKRVAAPIARDYSSAYGKKAFLMRRGPQKT